MIPRLALLLTLSSALLLSACGGYTPRVDAPATVTVGKPASATADTDCQPGITGCPGGNLHIHRFEVTPATHVTDVERTGTLLKFTPTRPGTLRVVLEATLDGEPTRAEAIIEAR